MLDIYNYQAKGRPPYSSATIRFALHLRYTSLQSYKLLLEKFPLPSISTLHRIQAGGVDSLKGAKKLREKGHISSDVILMVDEMFLQKEASYQSGDYVGEDEEGELYKGIACFMIVGLKQSVPHVIQAITEVSITREWLAEKFQHHFIRCSKHNNWGLKFAAKIVINTFFNNKQTVSSDSARKDTVVAFKKRQRIK